MSATGIGGSHVAFIDDSGDSTNNFLLSALVISAALQEHVLDSVAGHFARLRALYQLPVDFEFHGSELGGGRGGRDEASGVVLKPHERDFIFEHSFHAAAGLETVHLYTVFWDWRPGLAKVEDDQTSRRERVYSLLLDFIEEQGDQVAAAYVDGTNEQAAVRAFATHAGKHDYPFVIAEPTLVDSVQHPMIQLVDLVAYGSYQCVDVRNEANKPKYAQWHLATLHGIAVDGGSSYRARIYDGTRDPRFRPVPMTKQQKKRHQQRLEAAKWAHIP